jgi:predicted RND superfamily exporter protein
MTGGGSGLLERLAAFSVRRPWTVLALAALLVALAVGHAALTLTLRTSNLDLIDPDLPPVARFRAFAEEFGTPNLLVVALEGTDAARLEAAVDRLGPALAALPGVRGVIDRLPLDAARLDAWGIDRYVTSHDRELFFILVQPADPHSRAETIEPFVDGVRHVLAEAGLDRLGVHAALTGMPQYALDDRDVVRRDISRLSPISGLLVLLLFVAAFRAVRRPLLAGASLTVAVALMLGVISLVPGHLTLLSAFFASVLFGVGEDFGIHLVHRVEEHVTAGLPERLAVTQAVAALGRGFATAALTTATGFFSMLLCGFRGFAELGWIAGVGVFVCLLSTVTVLPALLALFPGGAPRPRRRASRIGVALLALERWRLAPALLALLALVPLAGLPRFDTDYLALEPRGSGAVRVEREMVRRSDLSPQFAAFVVDSRAQALALTDRLLDDETVGEVHSLAELEELAEDDPAALASLPASFVAGLRSPAGRYAVYAYPAEDVWEPAAQRRFIEHMQAIDPGVTGIPILGRYMVERSKRALWIVSALGAVGLVVWLGLDFRNARLAALALTPTLLAVGVLLGLMRLLGLSFNPLNIMALPVLLSLAVEYPLQVVHRFVAEGGDLPRTMLGAGRSVTLTSATTIAAFGALTFTAHRGLASFAILLVLGVAVAWILAVGLLPALLARFGGQAIGLPRAAERPARATERGLRPERP